MKTYNSHFRWLASLIIVFAVFAAISVPAQIRSWHYIPPKYLPPMGGVGDGGPAAAALIDGPAGLTVDYSGNLYVIENQGSRIRMIDGTTGIIKTVAGNGRRCCFEEGKLAAATSLDSPVAVAVDRERNIYIADVSARVRRVDAETGLITTVVRTARAKDRDLGSLPQLPAMEMIVGLAVDSVNPQEALFILTIEGRIYRVSDDTIALVFNGWEDRHIVQTGEKADRELLLQSPWGFAMDHSENFYIADSRSCRILRVDANSKQVSTVAGTGQCQEESTDWLPGPRTSLDRPRLVAVDADNNLYFSQAGPKCIRSVFAALDLVRSFGEACDVKPGKGNGPSGLATDSRGNLYFAEQEFNVVRKIDTRNATIETVAGNGPHGR